MCLLLKLEISKAHQATPMDRTFGILEIDQTASSWNLCHRLTLLSRTSPKPPISASFHPVSTVCLRRQIYIQAQETKMWMQRREQQMHSTHSPTEHHLQMNIHNYAFSVNKFTNSTALFMKNISYHVENFWKASLSTFSRLKQPMNCVAFWSSDVGVPNPMNCCLNLM